MIFCSSNVRAIRNGRARSFWVKIPTQKFRKRFFGIVGNNHCAVHITKRYRLRRQRSCAVYRTAVQFVRNRVRFPLPNRIQGMVSLRFRNNRIRRNIITFAVCFCIPTDKGIALVFHFHSGQLAISFAGRDFNVFRIIYVCSEI